MATLLGCSSGDRVPVYPVTGELRVKGEVAAGAKLIFHPSSRDLASRALFPAATVDSQGRFQLTTYESGDGAPEGDYKVTLSWRPKQNSADPDELHPDEIAALPELIDAAFSAPETTPLSVTISSGENSLPTFEVE